MEKLCIIVGGYIGLYPTGGATWDYIQYPLGLKMLGHDVYYIEDTMQYPVFQKEGKAWDDASDCIYYLQGIMENFGFRDRWAYRDIATGECYGMSEEKISAVCQAADVFINVSCSTYLRDEYLKIPNRILIDSDPMFTQVQYALELEGDAVGKNWNTKSMIENHNFLFSFGENIGAPDCKIPLYDFKWCVTRQPVCLNLWQSRETARNSAFTSIMNWSGRKKLIFDHDKWGQKDVEFEKIKEIPAQLPDVNFEVVVNKPLDKDSFFNAEALKNLGWRILDPPSTVADTADYKSFIENSTAEFSVAKETYVKSNSGWFSGRSACYLAAGKPVVTQETQWSKYIPSGMGLFAFTNFQSAVEAISKVKSNIGYHVKIARELAHEYFDSNKVLTKMLEQLS